MPYGDALNNPTPGFGNVGEYSLSGLPWVTGSNADNSGSLRLDFPKVTKSILVRNLDGTNDLYVGFTRNGVEDTHRYTIPPNTSELFTVRTKVLFLLGEAAPVPFSVFGELTTIPPQQAPLLTGSASGDPAGVNWQGVG